MADHRKISTQGTEFIKSWEAFSAVAYKDQAGKWTYGWGFTVRPDGKPVEEGDTITQSEADEYFEKLIAKYEQAVDGSLKMPLDQNQFDACVSLCYNIGISGWQNSTVLKEINLGNYRAAADAFRLWNKVTINGKKLVSNGLKNRREAERDMFTRMMSEPEPTTGDIKMEGGQLKPGKKTSELYVTIAGILAPIIAPIAASYLKIDLGPEVWASVIAAVGYNISRGMAKFGK